MSIALNRLEYFDKFCIRTDTDKMYQEIVKYHLGLAEALTRFKFWKSEIALIL